MAGGLYQPSAGDVLTAANAIDMWSKQVVIICTSGTRPSSPRAGMTIYQTDTNVYAVYGTAWCETTPISSKVNTSETTASASYVALTTAQSISITTGTKAVILMTAEIGVGTANAQYRVSYAVSGATTTAAADTDSLCAQQVNDATQRFVRATMESFATLTAGVNAFALQAKTNTGTLTCLNRVLTGIGIPT